MRRLINAMRLKLILELELELMKNDVELILSKLISKLEDLLRRLINAMRLKLKLELMKNDVELILSKLIASNRL